MSRFLPDCYYADTSRMKHLCFRYAFRGDNIKERKTFLPAYARRSSSVILHDSSTDSIGRAFPKTERKVPHQTGPTRARTDPNYTPARKTRKSHAFLKCDSWNSWFVKKKNSNSTQKLELRESSVQKLCNRNNSTLPFRPIYLTLCAINIQCDTSNYSHALFPSVTSKHLWCSDTWLRIEI